MVADFRFDKALAEVWELVRGLNQFLEEEQPWKKGDDAAELERILGHALADLNLLATLLLPFLPATAQKILATFEGGQVHVEVGVLFPRIDETPADDRLDESTF
jgi:methionyl-tRNA synthetase